MTGPAPAPPLDVPPPRPAPAWPPEPLSLPSGTVDVWVASLAAPVPARDDESAAALLDESERARAAKFAGEGARRRFVRSRALLRSVLGGYLGKDPADVAIAIGGEGKPYVVDPLGRPDCALRFNLSHSGDAWVLAARRDAEVGVDVERADRRADVDGVAGKMFAPTERAAIAALPEADARAAFFRVWTAREALVKCLGAGMFSLDLEFEVEADPDRPLVVRPAGRSARDPFPWRLGALPLAAGLAGALATRDEPRRVRTWRVGGKGVS